MHGECHGRVAPKSRQRKPINSSIHPPNHPKPPIHDYPFIHSSNPPNHPSIQPSKTTHSKLSFEPPIHHSSNHPTTLNPPPKPILRITPPPFHHPTIPQPHHTTSHAGMHASIHPSIHPFIHPSNHPSIHPSIHPCNPSSC